MAAVTRSLIEGLLSTEGTIVPSVTKAFENSGSSTLRGDKTIAVVRNCLTAQNPCMTVTRINGAQLHAARALAGISRETLAERAGVSRYSILKWENSSHATPEAMYRHICRAIGVLEAEGVVFTHNGVERAAMRPISATIASEGAIA